MKKSRLAKTREEAQKERIMRVKIRTQMDNSVDSFMYTVESNDLEVEKSAEKYLIDQLFSPDNLEKCEKAILAGKKNLKDPISSSQIIAKKAVQLAQAEKKAAVSATHVKAAIESKGRNVWPYSASKKSL